MIRAYLGTDFERRRDTIRAYIESLGAVDEVRIEGENLTSETLDEVLSSQSLFGEKKVLMIHNPSASAESWKLFSKNLEAMKTSSVAVLVSEETLTAPRLKELEKFAEQVERFDQKVITKKPAPIAFKLTDAFLKKDKKEMWIRYQEARKAGEEPEALHGALYWQIKSLALAHVSGSAAEAGLSPFVYSKAKAATRMYSEEDIRRISNELVILYHTSREPGEDLGEKLEAWILKSTTS